MKYLCEVKDPVATARLMRLFGWQVPLEDDLYKAYTIIVVKDKSLHNAYQKNSYGLSDIVGQTITEKELVELIVTEKTPEKPKISWSEVKVGETVNWGRTKLTKVDSWGDNIFRGSAGIYGVITDINEKVYTRESR